MKVIARWAAALSLLALAAPARAAALETLIMPIQGRIVLRYGETYGVADSLCTHRGLDLAGASGDEVAAPCAGLVRFSGEIPADGGGRCGAVTIETADGSLITVMPLRDVRVRAGAEVAAGQSIGVLAETGDASSRVPHLHLSVRVGGRYVNPEPLLASACGRTEGVPVQARAGEGDEPRAPSPAGVDARCTEPSTLPASEARGRAQSAGTYRIPVTDTGASERASAGQLGPRPTASEAFAPSEVEHVRDGVFRAIQAMHATSGVARTSARMPAAPSARPGTAVGVRAPRAFPAGGVWVAAWGGTVMLATALARRKAVAVR